MNNILQSAMKYLSGLVPSGSQSFDYRSPERIRAEGPIGSKQPATPSAMQSPQASPMAQALQQLSPQPQAQQPTPQATPIAIPQDQLRQNIQSTWGDAPILKDLDLFTQAGNQLPGNMEKLLPIALALRETQGGKDNMKPGAKTGQNNYFNIKGDAGWANYPDMKTAVLGNIDQGGISGGAYGLLSGTDPKSKSYYEDFRKTNDYKDLFKRWSPANDGNGSMDEQVQNIQWIINHIKNGKR